MSDEIDKIHLGDVNVFNQMKCPELIGTPSKANVKNVVQSISNNIANYIIAYPFSGVQTDYGYGETESSGFYKGRDYALGSNYFATLGGRCNEESVPKCIGKKQKTYIRNIPTGKIPLLGDISFQGLTGCNIDGITEGRGALPGMLEDISDISPNAMFQSLTRRGNYGSDKCELKTFPVGTHIYDPNMQCLKGENCKNNNKTWKMKTACTPSYSYLKSTTDTNANFVVPGAPSLFEFFDSSNHRKHNSAKLLQYLYWWKIVLFVFVILYFFYMFEK
jgi:hypothetical protein